MLLHSLWLFSSQRNVMAFGAETIHISSVRLLDSCYPVVFQFGGGELTDKQKGQR